MDWRRNCTTSNNARRASEFARSEVASPREFVSRRAPEDISQEKFTGSSALSGGLINGSWQGGYVFSLTVREVTALSIFTPRPDFSATAVSALAWGWLRALAAK